MKRNSYRNLSIFIVGCALVVAGVNFMRWRHARIDLGLIRATEVGNVVSMRRLILAGADVDQPVKDKFTKPTPATYFKNALRGALSRPRKPKTTPLMLAVATNRVDAVRLLLDHGALVDARDEYGFTALTMAISKRNPELVRMLLEHGANPNAPDDLNMPPLLWALMLRQTECACALLEHGADPNASDSDGTPALYLAVLEEDPRASQVLLMHGAEPNASFGGCTSLQLAVVQHDDSIAQALVQRGARGSASADANRPPRGTAQIAALGTPFHRHLP
jgi:hypothetical protein